jgi:co-chaperonin GroES (HSP10)
MASLDGGCQDEGLQTVMTEPQNPIPTIRPLGERILARQKAYTDQLPSGLYIPQGHRAGYEDRAEIIAIGPKVTADIKVGDIVIFERKPSRALNPDIREGDPENWKDLLMLKEDDILAVVEP